MKRKCLRCGKQFVPAKKHYRYCQACYPDVAPLGYTTRRQRPGAAARIHGGVSRTTDGRRPVVLRGDATAGETFQGLRAFLTDLYKHPTRVSTLLYDAGIYASQVEYLCEQKQLNTFILRFCPELWEWLGDTVGTKAREVVIDFYGLYGGGGRRIRSIAHDLGMTTDHARALRGWALKQVRALEKRSELEAMIVSTARSIGEALHRGRRPLITGGCTPALTRR